ncbi:MAG: hypothetical protein AAFX52_09355 [Pseudomonadota bacterium]
MRPNFYAIDAIAFGFRFALTGLPTALRLGWLPLLIITAASVQTTMSFMQAGIDPIETVRSGFGSMLDGGSEFELEIENQGDYEDLSPFVGLWGLLAIIGYVLLIPAAVALYRQAANVETRGGFLPVFGGPEWRFLFSFVVQYLVIVGFAIASSAAVALGVLVGASIGVEVLAAVAALAVTLLMFWFFVRFSLFQPVVAITNSLSVPAAFGVTAGRFWKLIGTFILLVLITCLLLVAVAIVFGTALTVSGFGSPAYFGFTTAAYVVYTLVCLFSVGVIGRITGDLLGTTADDFDEDPFAGDDEPEDGADDLLDEIIGDDEADFAADSVQYADQDQTSYDAEGFMMRRNNGQDHQQSFAASPDQTRVASKRRSSIGFIRTRFR